MHVDGREGNTASGGTDQELVVTTHNLRNRAIRDFRQIASAVAHERHDVVVKRSADDFSISFGIRFAELDEAVGRPKVEVRGFLALSGKHDALAVTIPVHDRHVEISLQLTL